MKSDSHIGRTNVELKYTAPSTSCVTCWVFQLVLTKDKPLLDTTRNLVDRLAGMLLLYSKCILSSAAHYYCSSESGEEIVTKKLSMLKPYYVAFS